MKGDAEKTLTKLDKRELKSVLEAKAAAPAPIVGKARPFVKKWKLDELAPIVNKGLAGATSTAAAGFSVKPNASPVTASTTKAAPWDRT